MTLKSLAPVKTKCTGERSSLCREASTGEAYYMDTTTRKLAGYIWICDYTCDDEPAFNVVIWDTKNKIPVIAYGPEVQQVSASDILVFGKNATKAGGVINFIGTDGSGDMAIDVVACGLNGKLSRPKDGSDCFIQSLSGHATGVVKYVKPGTPANAADCKFCGGNDAESYIAKIFPLCSACSFNGWCDADDAPDMVPCTGTWEIKYNKKASTGSKPISQLIPEYAR